MRNLVGDAMRALGRIVESAVEAERAARERDRGAVIDAYNARAAGRARAQPGAGIRPASPAASSDAVAGSPSAAHGGRPYDPVAPPGSLPALFADRERLLSAVVMSEVLAPPVSLR